MKYDVKKLFDALKNAKYPVIKAYEDGSADFSRKLTDEENESLADIIANAEIVDETDGPSSEGITEDDVKAIVKSAIEETMKMIPAPDMAGYHVPNVKKITKPGFKDEDMQAFRHYIRTGDKVAAKAALQEGTAEEGGYVVPDDFYGQIVEKRDEMSIARKAGARIIPTSLAVVDVPVEDDGSEFGFTAEEAEYNEDEPTLGQVPVTVHKATLEVKMSEELAADQKADLDGFLSRHAARKAAKHENKYVLIGTGSSEPQGILVGGTAGLTFDSATAIGAAEVPELYYKLGSDYTEDAIWTMRSQTYGHLMGLTGNPFQFAPTPGGDPTRPSLLFKSAYFSDSMEALATGKKPVAVGDWYYYALVERQSMVVQRNPYLYQKTGQIAIFFKIRWGGAVLLAEAFQYATHP